jgi:hypothetical protein
MLETAAAVPRRLHDRPAPAVAANTSTGIGISAKPISPNNVNNELNWWREP